MSVMTREATGAHWPLLAGQVAALACRADRRPGIWYADRPRGRESLVGLYMPGSITRPDISPVLDKLSGHAAQIGMDELARTDYETEDEHGDCCGMAILFSANGYDPELFAVIARGCGLSVGDTVVSDQV